MQDSEFMEERRTGRSRRRGVTERGGSGGAKGPGPKTRRAKKPRSASFIRARRIAILAVLEVFVLAGIFAYSYVLKQYNKIQRPDFQAKNVENKELSSEDIQKMKGYWNIAVFGVDSRNSSLGRGYNSDVIMVVSLNRENGEIRIVSVYRDTYLALGNGSYSKINQAYAVGGPEQAVRALNQNLDLNITDYVTFNWKAVATGVNILGGVDVEISKPEFRYINSYITETVKGTGIGSVQLKQPGMQHLDGVQAVAYARLRYMDDDYTRTQRQRKIIELCVDKAKRADPQTLSDLAGNLLTMVATSLKWDDGMSMALNVKKYKIAETSGFPMDKKEVVMGKRGACVLPNTLEGNVKELHRFFFGDTDYSVSKQVREIDYKLAVDQTNYKNQAAERKNARENEETEPESSASAGEEESSGQESGGRAESLYTETDEYGNPLLQTDREGRVVETDEYGNPWFDYEESDAEEEFETDPFGRPLEPSARSTEELPGGARRPSDGSGQVSPLPPETFPQRTAQPGSAAEEFPAPGGRPAPGGETQGSELTEAGPGSAESASERLPAPPAAALPGQEGPGGVRPAGPLP